MYRLGGTDAAMLYAETDAAPMYACTLTILDPSTTSGPLDVERFREIMLARGDRLQPFRQRLATVPFGMDRPVWVDDGAVDLRAHIRGIAVPRPGSSRQVAELVSDLMLQPLAPDRPLWRSWFIEGLEGGRIGLFFKVHHALLGGARAMAVFELLFDLDAAVPLAPTVPAVPAAPSGERSPSPLAVAGHAAWSLAGTPIRLVQTATDIARATLRVTRFRANDLWADAVLPFEAPPTSLNGRVDATRTCAFGEISMPDVIAVKRAFGVTVNDVVLAVCGGALSRYLQERGEHPERALTASVPVSIDVRGGGDRLVLGNAVSNVGATLATDVADPVERLLRIASSTRAAKGLHAALGPELILSLAELLPPGLTGAAMRRLSAPGLASHAPPPYNVIVSNLPGPRVPLYSGGARLVATHLFGPLIQGLGLNITVLSYVDRIDIGLTACPALVPNPWPIATAMQPALDELRSALPRTTRPSPWVISA
jgi:diacylglycerol O-acyltransferase / wax synthase